MYDSNLTRFKARLTDTVKYGIFEPYIKVISGLSSYGYLTQSVQTTGGVRHSPQQEVYDIAPEGMMFSGVCGKCREALLTLFRL